MTRRAHKLIWPLLLLLTLAAAGESLDAPESVRLRTGVIMLDVQQTSRIAVQEPHGGLHWFVDTTSYLFDGSLIIGNSRDNLSLAIYQTPGSEGPPDNPWKQLYAAGPMSADTLWSYRHANGSGYNHDSTIAFDVDWYAPSHPDSATFMVGHFNIYAGPEWTAPLENVVIAYAADFDIPSDTANDNRGFADAAEQTVYQQGLYTGSPQSNELRFGGISYRDHDSTMVLAAGGFVWDNPRSVDLYGGYHVDSLWAHLSTTSGWEAMIPDSMAAGEDLNSILVVSGGTTITDASAFEFNLVLWGVNPNEQVQPQNYTDILRRAERFICDHISPGAGFCGGTQDICDDCTPGDANDDGLIAITDAIYVIQYIFNNGPAPKPWSVCSGDYNGDCIVNITDVVAHLKWTFDNGPRPVFCEEWKQSCDDPGTHYQ